MELNTINNTGSWGNSANRLNENFSKVNTEVEKLKNATTRNKGYFATDAELKDSHPTASAGDIAYVGTSYPYQIWKWNGTTWTYSNAVGGSETVNLGNYYTREDIDTQQQQQDDALSLITENQTEQENKILSVEKTLENLEVAGVDVASADKLGGITAETKTEAETVEAKIDPKTGKLYVPVGGNNPDNEDIHSVEVGKTSVLQFANKSYNTADFSGLGRVYLRKNISASKNVLTQAMVNQTNTRYVIQYDYDLNGGTINIPNNCVLDFQGGSFVNGTVVGNYTTIISEHRVFGSSMSFGGTFNMNSVNAIWFGIKSGIDNIVPYFNLMLDFCINTNVKNIIMPSGTFNIKEPLIIGNGERAGWFINIFGAGANEALGTFFKIFDGAYILIDQKNTAYGSLRSGGIFDCAFQSASRAKNKGIVVTSGIAYSILRCHFSLFDSAINLTGDTHFAYIAQCLFEACNDGVVSLDTDDELYLEGSPNNNIITGCWFTYCSRNPIRTTYENVMWDISSCDFEGSNGTVFLTRLHRIRNCRFERNDVTTPDLKMDSNNVCDCSFFYVGGAPTAWKIEIIGNYNKIYSYFSGFVPFTIVSYGIGNEFDLTFPTISYTTPNPLILIDPEDKVTINGYCNKENLYGENILSGISVTFEDSASEHYHEYECKKITSAATYIATKSMSDVTEMYISGKFNI